MDFKKQKELFDIICARITSGHSCILITLVEAKGSVPQNIGAKALCDEHGYLIAGTVGGGRLEAAALEFAEVLIKSNEAQTKLKVFNLNRDLKMSCGGEATLLFEVYRARPSFDIAVFGAGHVAQELIPLLSRLNCKISWVDPRQEWLDKGPKSENIHRILTSEMSSVIQALPKSSYIVIVTQGHTLDLPILKEALRRDCFPYIGVIGSETKAKALRHELSKENLAKNKIDSFFCPIGENWGNNEPYEIALSIVAQIMNIRDKFK